MNKPVSRDALIIEMMPFSDSLKKWCKENVEFRQALKIIHPARFITLQAISVSYSPKYPNNQVIGVYSYDLEENQKKFKQDFIVNIESKDKEFYLYTKLPKPDYGKYVQHINNFYSKYASEDTYHNTHHLTLEELPKEIWPRAQDAIDLAGRLQKRGVRNITDREFIYIKKELLYIQTADK